MGSSINCETYEDLVEEVLDELLLERARSQEAVEIGSEELGDEIAAGSLVPGSGVVANLYLLDVHVLERRDEDVAQADNLQGWSVPLLARTRGVSKGGVEG